MNEELPAELFCRGGEATSKALAPAYETVAKAGDCHFLDASKFLQASKVDGVHLDPDGHRKLALEVKKVVAPLMSGA